MPIVWERFNLVQQVGNIFLHTNRFVCHGCVTSANSANVSWIFMNALPISPLSPGSGLGSLDNPCGRSMTHSQRAGSSTQLLVELLDPILAEGYCELRCHERDCAVLFEHMLEVKRAPCRLQ